MNDSEAQYYMDGVARLADLMKDTYKDQLKEYYVGLPEFEPPAAAYPCCIVHKIAGKIGSERTGEDYMMSQINIHILFSSSADTKNPQPGDVTMRKLQLFVEGRDPDSRQWKAGTALHALRTNLSLSDDMSLTLDEDIQYDATTYDSVTIKEAIIQVIVKERVSVPRR